MDAEEKRQAIEVEILKVIKEKLETGKMDAQRASEIAKLVLKTLPPGISLEEIYRVVSHLDDQFSELSTVVLPIVREYEEKVEKVVRQKVETLIKQGQFSQASYLAQQLAQKKIPLSKKIE